MPATGKRRAYGQHFLVAPALCAQIVDTFAAEARDCSSWLEIGPGKGALTRLLLAVPNRPPLVICERDAQFAEHWRREAQSQSPSHSPSRDQAPVRVERADFLELPREAWVTQPPLGVLSNLPYSSGTAILQRLARELETISVMVLMFQREVARRLRAEPDTREWGSLSLWVQNRWDVTRVADAPPGAFAPPPDVHSEVVLLRRRAEPRLPVGPADEALWEKLLKTCFAQRRKMLRGSLPKTGPWRPALEKAGIDPTLRAEALGWEQWKAFFLSLDKSPADR